MSRIAPKKWAPTEGERADLVRNHGQLTRKVRVTKKVRLDPRVQSIVTMVMPLHATSFHACGTSLSPETVRLEHHVSAQA